jgi:hypothetical protein
MNITAEDYHADRITDAITASRSCLYQLATVSPYEAWLYHPRMGGHSKPSTPSLNWGTLRHAQLAGEVLPIVVIDEDSYRRKAARELRDTAIEAGKIPMLEKEYDKFSSTFVGVKHVIDSCMEDVPMVDAKIEETLVWQEHAAHFRCRPDVMVNGYLIDYKTTSKPLTDHALKRAIVSYGYDFQAAMYLRGAKAVMGKEHQFGFVFISEEPTPRARLIWLSKEWLSIADEKVDGAMKVWSECLATDNWPDLPRVTELEPPDWMVTKAIDDIEIETDEE